MKKILFVLIANIFQLLAVAQTQVKEDHWTINISKEGYIQNIIYHSDVKSDTIPFFTEEEEIVGPRFYLKDGEKEDSSSWTSLGNNKFKATIKGIECELTYKSHNTQPSIEVSIHNTTHVPFQPEKAGLKLGIDTYMDNYPDWFGKYFPTLMYCEKTHFYGYLQTPAKHTLGIVSEQAIASWSVDYNLGYMDPPPHWFMGHRIESLNLDLINALPLPDRNPQHLYQLKQGETKTWIISLVNVGELEQLETKLRTMSKIPLIKMEGTNFIAKDTLSFEIFASSPKVTICNDKGESIDLKIEQKDKDKYIVTSTLPEVGLYNVEVESEGLKAGAMLLARHSWQWVLENARTATLKYHQKATSHAESWYGFYSAFIAQKYFSNPNEDKKINDRFEYLYDLLHNLEDEPLYYASRIQNTSTTIGILVDKYEADGDIKNIERASRLADWMIENWQQEDGAFCNNGVIYTSVIYIAKSVLELAEIEKQLGKKDKHWKETYKKHYASAKKAVDQLVASQGDFQTEGELTFEDGMISCSALQIGMLATLEGNKKEKERYTQAMLEILESHDCLTQLKVPDARRRQGTMRYWEAQYDVQMLPNMFSSPHGWSGWRAYATYYAYLLTGNERWLTETYNAMSSFSNLLDYKTGDLRWAFIVDPHLKVEQACSPDLEVTQDSLSFGNPHPKLYDTKHFVIGEQYVNMVSNWQTTNTQDNDVHELFKCIGETVLTNAFIVERADGTLKAYNCTLTKNEDTIEVISLENQITNLHCNLQKAYTIKFKTPNTEFESKKAKAKYCDWLFN